jgi:hypothetical protein
MKSSLRFSLKLTFPLLFSFLCLYSFASYDDQPGIVLPGPNSTPMVAVILQPTDSVIDGVPVLQMMDKGDTVAQIVYHLFRDSYMGDAVRFYYAAQYYLINAGKLEKPEPAYLLLSNNQGGFPRSGFYLQVEDSIIDKTETPYIDLVKGNTKPEDHLGSMTQIYPHEMGHIIYGMLSEDVDSLLPGGVDIHYATLTTDYSTAFNEGFAMHFENMARKYDPNVERREAIRADFEDVKKDVMWKINGFERDFKWPFRFGFYRLSMLEWFQKLEDIKRFEWVNDNRMKFNNASALFRNPEKSLYYRNAGVRHTSVIRPVQQSLATEGVIASFFVGLMNSDAKTHYRAPEFYRQFSMGSDSTSEDLMGQVSPIDNQYMKIFDVLHRHVNKSLSIHSQLLDFVTGYIDENPMEASLVKKVFYGSTGHAYPLDPGRERWITNPSHEHGILVMDQTGSIAVPYYTFNLNAATEADLLTFDAITREEAGAIINHIHGKGPLNQYSDLRTIPGVSEATAELLAKSKFDPAFFESMEGEGITLSLDSLLISFLKKLLIVGLFYGLAAVIPAFWLNQRVSGQLKKVSLLWLSLRYLALLLVALAAVAMTPLPLAYFAGGSVLIVVITLLFFKSGRKKRQFLLSTLPMIFVLAYALI